MAHGAYAGKLVGWATDKLKLALDLKLALNLKLALDIVKRTDDMTGFVVLRRRWVIVMSRRLIRRPRQARTS